MHQPPDNDTNASNDAPGVLDSDEVQRQAYDSLDQALYVSMQCMDVDVAAAHAQFHTVLGEEQRTSMLYRNRYVAVKALSYISKVMGKDRKCGGGSVDMVDCDGVPLTANDAKREPFTNALKSYFQHIVGVCTCIDASMATLLNADPVLVADASFLLALNFNTNDDITPEEVGLKAYGTKSMRAKQRMYTLMGLMNAQSQFRISMPTPYDFFVLYEQGGVPQSWNDVTERALIGLYILMVMSFTPLFYTVAYGADIAMLVSLYLHRQHIGMKDDHGESSTDDVCSVPVMDTSDAYKRYGKWCKHTKHEMEQYLLELHALLNRELTGLHQVDDDATSEHVATQVTPKDIVYRWYNVALNNVAAYHAKRERVTMRHHGRRQSPVKVCGDRMTLKRMLSSPLRMDVDVKQ